MTLTIWQSRHLDYYVFCVYIMYTRMSFKLNYTAMFCYFIDKYVKY